jgi:hypothetical protein
MSLRKAGIFAVIIVRVRLGKPTADPQRESSPDSNTQGGELPPSIAAFVEALARVQEERDYQDLPNQHAGLPEDRRS